MPVDGDLDQSPGVGRRILITGGAGFIGCAVSHRLAPESERYVVVDNLHPQVHKASRRPAALHSNAELVVADVTDPGTWDSLLARFEPEIVVHLAAETGTAQSLTEGSRHAAVNVLGTTRMLDALAHRGVKPGRVVLCSSRAVYGEGRWQRADGRIFYPGQRSHAQLESGQWDFPEASALPSDVSSTEPRPTSIYGATKLSQEHVLSAWCSAMGVSLTVLRLQNVYGPGQSLTNSYTGIVSLFSQMARAGEVIPLYEDGEVTRDFVFIDDVADAIAAAVVVADRRPIWADIGSGVPTSLRTLASEIASLRGAPSPRTTGRFRDGDVRHAWCSIELAEQLLRWRPAWTLRRGLEALQGWIDEELTAQAQS